MAKARYRVVQWATGNIGLRSLRAVIEHPDLDLVGVYVYSDSKVGCDAGELCGLGPVGIKATKDFDEILALNADCVLYMANHSDIDELTRLLESGVNVVSTAGELHRPASMDPTRRERIEDACRRGGSSIHATGSSPGFITEAVPVVMASLARRLDRLTIDEYADMSSRNSPEMIFALFGGDPGGFERGNRTAPTVSGCGPSFHLLADAMSVPLDEVAVVSEVAVARRDVYVAAGTIEAGTIAARQQETTGIRNGAVLLRMRQTLYVTTDLDPDFQLEGVPSPAGWRMQVEGDTPLDISIGFPVPEAEYAAFTPGLTAHRPVNAVPYVCQAGPGIKTTLDLPQVIAQFG
jgi:4-hydroxy-tetrahydrodipicolinate reductase